MKPENFLCSSIHGNRSIHIKLHLLTNQFFYKIASLCLENSVKLCVWLMSGWLRDQGSLCRLPSVSILIHRSTATLKPPTVEMNNMDQVGAGQYADRPRPPTDTIERPEDGDKALTSTRPKTAPWDGPIHGCHQGVLLLRGG